MFPTRYTLVLFSALLLAEPQSRAGFEIYNSDMEEAYECVSSTRAPCSNPGYFTVPPKYDIGACGTCQAELGRARRHVEGYHDLCGHTRAVEQETSKITSSLADGTRLHQSNTEFNGVNTHNSGSNGEILKRNDADTLRGWAKKCGAAVNCSGNIAPEDREAGKKVKKACAHLEDGSNSTYMEKSGNSSQMNDLSGRGTGYNNGLNAMDPAGTFANGAVDGLVGSGPSTIAASAGVLGLAAMGVGAGLGVGKWGGTKAQSDAAYKEFIAKVMGKDSAGGYQGSAGGGDRIPTWNDYMKASRGTEPSSSFGSTPSTYSLAGGLRSASVSNNEGASSAADNSAKPEEKERPQAYGDAWLSFVGRESSKALVEKLTRDGAMRVKLRKKVAELEKALAEGAQVEEDKLDFYKTALAEAESQLQNGTLDQLAPLDSQAVFGMDGDETGREVSRMIAGLDEDPQNELFPRMHRAIWRHYAAGNLRAKQRR